MDVQVDARRADGNGASECRADDRSGGAERGAGADEDASDRVAVGIAEYGVTTAGEPLATSGLGSCVAIALYDARTTIAGLVHVMLPAATEGAGGVEAKYADSGIEALVRAMEKAGADGARIEAKIAGGSEMLSFGGDGPSIGARNVEATKTTLARLGISLLGEDVGGDAGRSVTLDPETGEVVIKVARGGERTL